MTEFAREGDGVSSSKRVSVAALIAALLFVVFVAPFNVAAFYAPEGVWQGAMWISVVIAAALVYAAVTIGVRLVVRVRAGSRRAKIGLQAGSAVAVLNIAVLLLIWPGYWVWDEMLFSYPLSVGYVWDWQGILTYLYQAVGVALVGSVQGVMLIQVATVAGVTGWIVGETSAMLSRPALAWWVAVPAAFVPTVLDNLYPLRLTEYAYIALAVLFSLFLMIRQPRRFRSPGRAVFVVACSSGVLMMWRGEGIVFLFAPVVAAVALGFFRKGGIRPIVRATTACCSILVIAAMHFVNAAYTSPRYEFTAYLSPLSRIVQIGPEDATERELYEQIDRVIDIDLLKRHPSDFEIPAYWSEPDLVSADFESNMKEFRNATLMLFLRHPRVYLENRVASFLAASGIDGPVAQVRNGAGFIDPPDESVARERAVFEQLNPIATPISVPTRNATVQWMLTIDDSGAKTVVTPFVWTVIPSICALILVCGTMLYYRAWLMACLPAMVLASAGLVFLTAPGSYFMYYFPAYLIGWFSLAIMIVLAVDGHRKRRISKAPATSA